MASLYTCYSGPPAPIFTLLGASYFRKYSEDLPPLPDIDDLADLELLIINALWDAMQKTGVRMVELRTINDTRVVDVRALAHHDREGILGLRRVVVEDNLTEVLEMVRRLESRVYLSVPTMSNADMAS